MAGFALPVRVYLEDTDAQGVVYNASYFRFMERARTERLRASGIDSRRVCACTMGIALVLTGVSARFRSPARLSDMLYVGADVDEVRGARVVFAQSVRRDSEEGELVCEGKAEVACMDLGEGRAEALAQGINEGTVTMTGDLSMLSLILAASIPVKAVMLLLLLASIASWAVIFDKRRLLRDAVGAADEFETDFWSGVDLANVYRELSAEEKTPLGMAGIFESGFREFGRLREESGMTSGQVVEGARRSMRVSQLREMDRLEQNLAFLATVGSTSPYIGLFGTVWGIMDSFISLGNVQSATISMVAPGIAEALIATAMGLFAAIPAVIAFNRYADQVGRLEVRYDTFMEELSAIFQRSSGRLDTVGVVQ